MEPTGAAASPDLHVLLSAKIADMSAKRGKRTSRKFGGKALEDAPAGAALLAPRSSSRLRSRSAGAPSAAEAAPRARGLGRNGLASHAVQQPIPRAFK